MMKSKIQKNPAYTEEDYSKEQYKITNYKNKIKNYQNNKFYQNKT